MIPYQIFKETQDHCGPASLKTVFDYYGVVKSEKEWDELAGFVEGEGVWMSDLLRVVEQVGFKGEYLKETSIDTLRSLIQNKETVIVNFWHIEAGHYSPVADITDTNIIIAEVFKAELLTLDLIKFELNWFDFLYYPPRSKDDLLLREALVIRKP